MKTEGYSKILIQELSILKDTDWLTETNVLIFSITYLYIKCCVFLVLAYGWPTKKTAIDFFYLNFESQK